MHSQNLRPTWLHTSTLFAALTTISCATVVADGGNFDSGTGGDGIAAGLDEAASGGSSSEGAGGTGEMGTDPAGSGGTGMGSGGTTMVEAPPIMDVCTPRPLALIDTFESANSFLTPGDPFSASWRWFQPDQRAAQSLPRELDNGCAGPDGTAAVAMRHPANRLEIFHTNTNTPVRSHGYTGIQFLAKGEGNLSLTLIAEDGTELQRNSIELTEYYQVVQFPFEPAAQNMRLDVISWENSIIGHFLIDDFGMY